MGIGGYAGSRSSKIYPEEVFHTTLGVLRNDSKTAEMLGGELGGHLESHGLRAYKIDGGSLSVVDRSVQWVPQRIQMIFDVRGELYDGLATVEAVRLLLVFG